MTTRVAIAGADNVGQSIARKLISNGHQVLLIEKGPMAINPGFVPGVEWFQADACELQILEEAELENCDVAIAVSGDDKMNLVHSLLAKTELGVPRTVARINYPGNEWLFNEAWGADVAVSTPRIMSALMEETVTTGDLVWLFTFTGSMTNFSEIRLLRQSPFVGRRIRNPELPREVVLVVIIRSGIPLVPERDDAPEVMDEMLFVASQDAEGELSSMLASTD